MTPRTDDLTVLQVNTADIDGGAERVMLDLHREYLARGIDSWIAVGHARSEDPRTLHIDNRAARSAWTRALSPAAGGAGRRSAAPRPASPLTVARLVMSDPRRYRRILPGLEDYDFPATASLLALPPRAPGVLHLHNLHGYYFDLRTLPALTRAVPAVLTLHDAWLLTGHCAHPFDCPRWRTGCGDCPDLSMYVPIRRDASAENWRAKRDILGRSRLCLVTPSEWLMRMVREAGLAEDHPTRVIPNGVDVSVFRPGSCRDARESLGLPADREILLVVANALMRNPFKDVETLVAALLAVAGFRERRPLLLAVGAEAPLDVEGIETMAVPFVEDPARVAAYYQAADVYVHPALAENLPLTVIEAMACGTPVVASDVGGVGELVVDGVTGLLVPCRDSEALASAITELLDDGDRREAFGRAAAQRVLEHFTLEKQADAYLGLYAVLRRAWAAGV
jgi:glycosyltransferase involved in cell wall biosynthesis